MFKPGDQVLVMLMGFTIRIHHEIEIACGYYVGPDEKRGGKVLVDLIDPFSDKIGKRVSVDREFVTHAFGGGRGQKAEGRSA